MFFLKSSLCPSGAPLLGIGTEMNWSGLWKVNHGPHPAPLCPLLESCLPAVTLSGRAQPWVGTPKLLGSPLSCPTGSLEGNSSLQLPLSRGLRSRQQGCLLKEVSGQFPCQAAGNWREPVAAGCRGMAEVVSGCPLPALLEPWDRLWSRRAGVRAGKKVLVCALPILLCGSALTS